MGIEGCHGGPTSFDDCHGEPSLLPSPDLDLAGIQEEIKELAMSALAAGISGADGCPRGGNGANKEGEAERADGVPQHLQHRLCL